MNRFFAQLSLAFQSLRQAPGFVASVVATMACTLAVVFVIASLVNAYFIRPLKVYDEANLYTVEQSITTEAGVYDGFQSYKAIVHWMRTQTSFDYAFAINPADQVLLNLPGEPKLVSTYASVDYFKLFDVPLILGRGFDSELAFDQASQEALISEDMWNRYFDRADDVIGKTLVHQGERVYTIIGVVSDEFEPPHMFYDGVSDLWLHFGSDPRFFNDGRWDNPWNNTYGSLKIVGVAKQGLGAKDVFADFDASIESIRAEWMEGYPTASDIAPIITSFRERELGDKGHLSLFLLAATLGLLMIAILNVSNLLLSRALAQHRTLALQAVLGAKRRTLFTSIFTQTLLLMMASVAVALFLAAWGIKGFKLLTQGSLPLLGSVQIDIVVVLVAVASCVLLAYVFALVSSSLVNFKALRGQLQQSGKNSGQTLSSRKTRLLVGCQMGVATALIVTAAFSLARTHETLSRPMGSQVENMYNIAFFIPGIDQELSAAEMFDKREQLLAHLRAKPEVKKVSLGRSPVRQNVTASTMTDAQGIESIFVPQSWVGAAYFDHIGLKVLAGRTYSDAALRGEKYEALVSEAMAKLLDPEGDVIGKVYSGHDREYEVVGITENFNHPNHFKKDQGRHIWWNIDPRGYMFIVELHAGKQLSREDWLTYVRADDERYFMWDHLSLEKEHNAMLHIDKITLYGSYLLAGFTLLLACVGIFGVLSYNLNMRRFEFGLRMALGAKANRLYRLLGRDVMVPLFSGSLVASALTLLVLKLQSQQLAQWLAMSPAFAVPAVLLSLGIALLSGYWPMRNVLKRQPMHALRNE